LAAGNVLVARGRLQRREHCPAARDRHAQRLVVLLLVQEWDEGFFQTLAIRFPEARPARLVADLDFETTVVPLAVEEDVDAVDALRLGPRSRPLLEELGPLPLVPLRLVVRFLAVGGNVAEGLEDDLPFGPLPDLVDALVCLVLGAVGEE